MNWDDIFQTLEDEDTLSHFALPGLPMKTTSIGSSSYMNFLALPFARNALVESMPNLEHLSYLKHLGLGPSVLELERPLRQYQRTFQLVPSVESLELRKAWSSSEGLFDFPESEFASFIDRSFILGNEIHGLKTIPSLDLEKQSYTVEEVDEILRPFSNESSGLVFRSKHSIQGDQIKLIKNEADLELILNSQKQGLLVKLIGVNEIVHDLGLSISLDKGKAILLGCTEQLTKNFRHYGCKSFTPSDFISKQLDTFTKKLGELLISKGVHRGIFGVEGFILKTQDQLEFFAYDFNPCVSQNFFNLMLTELLANKFSKRFNTLTEMISIYTPSETNLHLEWINPKEHNSGVFPLIYSDNVAKNCPFKRYIVMVAALDSKRPETALELWKQNLHRNEYGKILKIQEMFY